MRLRTNNNNVDVHCDEIKTNVEYRVLQWLRKAAPIPSRRLFARGAFSLTASFCLRRLFILQRLDTDGVDLLSGVFLSAQVSRDKKVKIVIYLNYVFLQN